MIDRLPETPVSVSLEETPLEKSIINENTKTKKVMKSLFNNAGILIGVFIIFAVIVIVTTDVHLASFEELSGIGLDFFLLFFCSYSMYVSCSDSGMRAGLNTKAYAETTARYEKLKQYLIENNLQAGLFDFCQDYIARELKSTRMSILAPAGFTYDEYTQSWMNADDKTIQGDTTLSEIQKKALIKTNKIKPIVLTTEHIVRKGRNEGRRAPLGTSPRTKKKINFSVKFFSTLILSGGVVLIVLDFVANPTWTIFATVTLKLLTVVVNGFNGYKFGYENVVIDTCEYVTDQTDILEEAIKYIETNLIFRAGGVLKCGTRTTESESASSPQENSESLSTKPISQTSNECSLNN
jgi:hypothetical protein